MYEKNKKPQETIELNDDQLEGVAGGTDATTKMMICYKCYQHVQHEFRGDDWYCTVCGESHYNYVRDESHDDDLLRPVITR